jgi:hypothetical protein
MKERKQTAQNDDFFHSPTLTRQDSLPSKGGTAEAPSRGRLKTIIQRGRRREITGGVPSGVR